MRSERSTALLIVALLIALDISAVSPNVLQPLALARHTGRLYLLDHSGEIYRSRSSSDLSDFVSFARMPPVEQGIDLAVLEISGREHLFVLSVGTTARDSAGRLTAYSVEGEQLAVWKLPGHCAGIGAVTQSGVTSLYLASSSDGAIYRIIVPSRLKGSPAPKVNRVVQVKIGPNHRLGPLVITGDRNLFVAEIVTGRLFRADYNQGGAAQVASGLGQPAALLYDERRNRIISLDAVRRKLQVMDIHDLLVSPPRDYVASELFKNPITLAMNDRSEILVGDPLARRIFFVSFDRKVR